MSFKRIMAKVIDAAYFLGAAVIVYHLGLALFAGNRIPYPDAMLPTDYLEIVLLRLAIGAVPETLVSVLFYRLHGFSSKEHLMRNRILVFLPSVICLLCLIFYVALIVYALLLFSRGGMRGM